MSICTSEDVVHEWCSSLDFATVYTPKPFMTWFSCNWYLSPAVTCTYLGPCRLIAGSHEAAVKSVLCENIRPLPALSSECRPLDYAVVRTSFDLLTCIAALLYDISLRVWMTHLTMNRGISYLYRWLTASSNHDGRPTTPALHQCIYHLLPTLLWRYIETGYCPGRNHCL